MNQYSVIETRADKFGQPWVLLNVKKNGYEIREPNTSMVRLWLAAGNVELAKRFFQDFCEKGCDPLQDPKVLERLGVSR